MVPPPGLIPGGKVPGVLGMLYASRMSAYDLDREVPEPESEVGRRLGPSGVGRRLMGPLLSPVGRRRGPSLEFDRRRGGPLEFDRRRGKGPPPTS